LNTGQNVIDEAVDQCKKAVMCMYVKVKERHFEYLLK